MRERSRNINSGEGDRDGAHESGQCESGEAPALVSAGGERADQPGTDDGAGSSDSGDLAETSDGDHYIRDAEW
jgi:Cu/Zn superoxide dismutase